MKVIVALLAAGLAAGAYYAKDNLFPKDEPAPATASSTGPNSTAASAPTTTTIAGVTTLNDGRKHIICPFCQGEQSIMIRTRAKVADTKTTCPICIGRGYRDVAIPAHRKICPDCRGMGSIVAEAKTGGKAAVRGVAPQKLSCERCSATGSVPSSAQVQNTAPGISR
jgi:hypothetical protein